jgi:hypothetical protein
MLTIKITLAVLLSVFYFIDMGRFPEKWRINFKPFNCHMCLSFYLAIVYFWLPAVVLNMLLVAFASGVAAPLFRNLMNNIFFKK